MPTAAPKATVADSTVHDATITILKQFDVHIIRTDPQFTCIIMRSAAMVSKVSSLWMLKGLGIIPNLRMPEHRIRGQLDSDFVVSKVVLTITTDTRKDHESVDS